MMSPQEDIKSSAILACSIKCPVSDIFYSFKISHSSCRHLLILLIQSELFIYCSSNVCVSVCVCISCQKASVISVWAPIFSQPSWPRLGLLLSPHLPSDSPFLPLTLKCSSMCLTPFFMGPPLLHASPTP